MKHIGIVIAILATIWTIYSQAQTRMQPSQLGSNTPQLTVFACGGGMRTCMLVNPSGAQIDPSTNPPTLRLLAATSPIQFPPDETYVVTTMPGNSYQVKCSLFDLYRNGLRQASSVLTTAPQPDFDLVGLTVRFRDTSAPQLGDIVIIAYRCSP